MSGPVTKQTRALLHRLGFEVFLIPGPLACSPPHGTAFIDEGFRRYITVEGDLYSDAITAFVIWHEAAHHVKMPGMLQSTIPSWQAELTADRFALDMLRGTVSDDEYAMLEGLVRQHIRPAVQRIINQPGYDVHRLDLKTCEWLGCDIPLDVRYMMLRDREVDEITQLGRSVHLNIDLGDMLDDEVPF